MEIQVSKLRNALLLLEPIVPKKPALEILTSVLLQNGRAVATNLEVAATIDLPEIQGEALLPFKDVLELLKYVPGNDVVAIETQGKSTLLKWSEGQSSYQTAKPADYPAMPKLTPLLSQSVPGNQLVPALSSVVDFCATDEKRPVLTGVSLFLGERLVVAAGDGFWMGYKTLPMAMPQSNGLKTVIIPSRTVEVLGHLWKTGPRPEPRDGANLIDLVASKGNLEIEITTGLIKVSFGAITLYSQLIQGTPPNFKALIPENYPNTVQIYAPDLERAVKRLKRTAKGGSEIVRMTWADGKMTLVAQEEGKSSIEVTIPVQTSNGAGRIAVNIKYLLKYLKDRQGLVTMQTQDPNKPLVLRHSSSPTVVLMPMFVKWPGDLPASPSAEGEAKVETEPVGKPEDEPEDGPEDGTAEATEQVE